MLGLGAAASFAAVVIFAAWALGGYVAETRACAELGHEVCAVEVMP